MARPGQSGHLYRTARAGRVAARPQPRVESAVPSGHSSPVVWGDRIFLTAAIEGEPIPGQKAVAHTVEGKPFVHPDSVAADRKHTLKVLALETRTGKTVWEQTVYEGPVYDARHRESSFAGPTAATDGTMVYA
jgi:outer membrane protein assembly factor BamB